MCIRITPCSVRICIRPQVTLISYQAVSAVGNAVCKPCNNLILCNRTAVYQRQGSLVIETGVEQPYAGHHTLGSPLGSLSFTKVGITLGGEYLNGLLQVRCNLSVNLIGR